MLAASTADSGGKNGVGTMPNRGSASQKRPLVEPDPQAEAAGTEAVLQDDAQAAVCGTDVDALGAG